MEERTPPAPAWQAEHTVGEAEAAALVAARFPDLAGHPVEPLAAGWDNTVYRVGEWVLRFPRRAVAVPGLIREAEILPRLAPRLPLPVPVPELADAPAAGHPWPCWRARLLPGREPAEAGLPDRDRGPAAAALGGFLRTLHDPALAAEFADLPVDPLRRADPGVRAPMARACLHRLAARGHPADPAAERLLAAGERLGPPAGPVVLSHGDLHVRHLLVDPAGRAAGVIDWGDLCLADPAVDLSVAYAAFTGAARAAFLAEYGPVGPERELRARVLALFLCAALAEYAADVGDAPLLAEARAGIRRACR